MLTEIPTDFYYVEQTIFGKPKNNKGTWTFEESGKKNVPSRVFVGFMHNYQNEERTHTESVFDWLAVSSAICRLQSDRYLDIFLNVDYPKNIFHVVH